MNTCMFCGFCERHGCEHFAKASPQTVLLPVLTKANGAPTAGAAPNGGAGSQPGAAAPQAAASAR
ncbi:MAG: family oxidoreductase [Ramlibacter sp.]|nr:family oxidoreductase [Ramlibacter sp.]